MNERKIPVPTQDPLGRDDGTMRAALRWALWWALAGVGFLVAAALLAGNCTAGADTMACGHAGRLLLALGAPVILLIGGAAAFWRTYRVWRAGGIWWGWQGAGWFLLTLMMLTLTLGFTPIAGPLTG